MAKSQSRVATRQPARAAAQPARAAPKPAAQPARAAAQPVRKPAEPPAEPKRNLPARPGTTGAMAEFGDMASVPAFMRNDAGMGKENIGSEDLQVPRLKLMQGTSKELTVYNDLRVGDFLHTAAEVIFNEPFRVVPIYMERRYILWRPLDDGGGILARADDGVHWSPSEGQFTVKLDRVYGGKQVTWKMSKTVQQSGLAGWGTMDPGDAQSPPAATLMYNYVFAFPDMPDLMPAVFTFQRSQIKVGRQLNTKLKTVRTPSFGLMFEMFSSDERNTANKDYKGVIIHGAGMVEDEEQYLQYKSLYEGFRNLGLQVKDIEGLQEEDLNSTDDPQEVEDAGRGTPNY